MTTSIGDDRHTIRDPDPAMTGLLVAVVLLTCLGTLAVQSSSITTRSPDFDPIFLSRHLINVALGVVLAAAASQVRPAFYSRTAWWMFFGTAAMLLLVAASPLGVSAGGATRWLRLPGFMMQPSEWAKLAIPILAARILSGRAHLLDQAVLFGSVGLMLLLVLRQPDLGTTILLAGGLGLALVLGGWSWRRLIAIAAASIAGLGLLTLRGYQLRRIEGLLATWHDWRNAPYQLRQSLIAFGEGGVEGVGLGRGWQKLSFLPEGHTDFVIAVIAEETGLIGVTLLTACWLTVLACGVRLLSRFPEESFRVILGGTLLCQVVGQAALNVAVVTAVIPPTGIPHPLLSYGGNSFLVTMISFGLIVSCTRSAVPAGTRVTDAGGIRLAPTRVA